MAVDKIRVLIVDDSPIARAILEMALAPRDDIELTGKATNGKQAVEMALRLSPDIITMDVVMPEKNGLQAIEEIMARHPTPILVLTSEPMEGTELCLKALGLGALGLMEKSVVKNNGNFFVERLRLLAKVPVIRHLGRNSPGDFYRIQGPRSQTVKIVLIGCSAGGPSAVCTLLKDLPFRLPTPVVICQHIPLGFSKEFSRWLQESCRLKAREAVDGEMPLPGTVLIVPAGANLSFRSSGAINLENAPHSHFSPSVDIMMKSSAKVFGAGALGILLTGIGEDGAKGLLEIKRNGGYTIVEDASSCLVFGMPKKAIDIGAACDVLPCCSIRNTLLSILGARQET